MRSGVERDPEAHDDVGAADRTLDLIEHLIQASKRLQASAERRKEHEATLHAAEEQLRRAYDELEHRVEERTRDLLQANAALRRREAQLAHAQHLARLGSWEWDVETDQIVWSDELYRIFGETTAYTPACAVLLARTHPDDREPMARAVQRALEDGEPFECECRVYRKDGAERILSGRGQKLHGDGGPPRLVGIVRDITEEKSAERRLLESLREKESLLKELHHRIKNNLQIVSSLLSLQGRMSDAPSRDLLRAAQCRVQSIALAHEAIHRSGDLTGIDVETYVHRLVGGIAGMYQRDGISVEFRVEPVWLGVDIAMHGSLLINELVTNAFKHAFPDGRKGTIRVALEREPGGGVLLTVADDGIGLPAGLDLRAARSLGLNLVVNLTEQLGGTIAVSGAGGASFTIRFLPDHKPGPL